MSKMLKTRYTNNKEILKFSDFIGIAVTVAAAGVTANADGKKIVPAGTIIGGSSASFLSDPTQLVTEKNSANAEGVLLYDVDVTHGDNAGSMVIHGFIDLTKLPAPPNAAAVTALRMIQFIA